MTQWGPFLAVTVLSLVVLLVLARRSQRLIRDDGQFRPDSTPPRPDGETRNDSPAIELESRNSTEVEPDSRPVETDAPAADIPEREPNTQATDVLEKEPNTPADELLGPEPPPHARTESVPSDRGQSPSRDSVELTTELMFLNVAFTQGLVVVVLAGAAWYFAVPADAFGIGGDQRVSGWATLPVGIGFGVLLWLGNEIATALADAVGAAYDEAVRELLAPESPGGWAILFGAVLPTIALGEELLFRGALIGVSHAGYGVSLWALAALSSVAFALGHGAQGRVGVVVTGLLGFVLAAGYVVTGSLVVVVAAHYVINALEFFVHELLGIEDSTVERVTALTR